MVSRRDGEDDTTRARICEREDLVVVEVEAMSANTEKRATAKFARVVTDDRRGCQMRRKRGGGVKTRQGGIREEPSDEGESQRESSEKAAVLIYEHSAYTTLLN